MKGNVGICAFRENKIVEQLHRIENRDQDCTQNGRANFSLVGLPPLSDVPAQVFFVENGIRLRHE